MSEGRARADGRARLISVLKILFAIALLAWVARGLPWRDVLEWHVSEDVVLAVEGEIVGDWRASSIEFRIGEEAVALGEPWPADLRAAQSSGANSATLELRDLDDPKAVGYGWRPGMPRVLRGLSIGGIALALASILFGVVFGVTRWWRLLRLARCPSSWLNTLRLTFLGLFFNLVFPGLTGGDVPKALLVVRENPDRRADALATVVIDRLVGLWGLIGLATVACWMGGSSFDPLRLPVTGALVLACGGMGFLLFPGPRRVLGLDALVDKLPQAERLKKLERSALVYAERPFELALAYLLSLGNHVCVITAIFFLGRDLGDALPYLDYFGIVPVANTISSLPISPSGWGIGEEAYRQLFVLMGSTSSLGVAVSVTFRLCNVILSLLGGLCLLLPGSGGSAAEVRRLAEMDREGESPE